MTVDIIEFNAVEVKSCLEDEDELVYVWVANKGLNPIRYLSLSSSSTDDEEDIYIERDDQSWGSYNEITNCRISLGHLLVEFSDIAAQELGGVKSISVNFDKMESKKMAETLRIIFRQNGSYCENL